MRAKRVLQFYEFVVAQAVVTPLGSQYTIYHKVYKDNSGSIKDF